MVRTFISYLILMAFNLSSYLFILYMTSPCIGDGSKEYIANQLLIANNTNSINATDVNNITDILSNITNSTGLNNSL